VAQTVVAAWEALSALQPDDERVMTMLQNAYSSSVASVMRSRRICASPRRGPGTPASISASLFS
jgi:hypothetical protein